MDLTTLTFDQLDVLTLDEWAILPFDLTVGGVGGVRSGRLGLGLGL